MARKAARALVVACLAGGTAALLAAGPLGGILERELGQYLLLRLRGPVAPPPGVVVVAQDHAGAAALGLPNDRLAAWPRGLLAQVIEQASAAGALAVAIDLKLEVARDEAGDAALERAIAASGRVVLVEDMTRVLRGGAPGGRDPALDEERVLPPLPRFAGGAALLAPFPLPQGWWRTAMVWAFKQGAGGRATLPAAALLAAALADPGAKAVLIAAAGAAGMPAVAGLAASTDLPLGHRVDELRALLGTEPEAAARLADRILATPGMAQRGVAEVGPAELAAAAVRLLAAPDLHLLLPYGPAGHLPRVRYESVVRREPAALAELRGRILFVGASDLTDQAGQDTYRTGLAGPAGVETAGVEIAATACLGFLHDDAVRPLARLPTALLAGTGAAAAAAAGMMLPAAAAAGLAIAAAGALMLLGLAVLTHWQLALPLGSLLALALPLGLLAGRSARRRALRRQLDLAVGLLTRGRLRRAVPLAELGRAVPRAERWAVCLATDLAEYTQLTEAERSRVAGLADLVAAYRELLHEVVERHGGTVLDFVGDASMCLWEGAAPTAAIRSCAVAAALELSERLDRFAAARGFPAQRTRIGLAEGRVVLGNLALGDRFAFGGVGDPFNVATRLEQLNKRLGTRVLATAGVVQGLDHVAQQPVGPMLLKGKAQPEEVVALDPADGARAAT